MIVYVGRHAPGKPTGPHVVLRADTSQRTAEGLNPRLDLRNHSPTGFSWGYGGSGPAQLALALLADAANDRLALELYQRFKQEVISRLERDTPWVLPQRDIVDWVANPEDHQFQLRPVAMETRVEIKLESIKLSDLPEQEQRTLLDAMRVAMIDKMAEAYSQLRNDKVPFLLGPFWGPHRIAYPLPDSELYECPGCYERTPCAYGPHAPTSGALAVCGYCGALLEFKPGLGLRAAAPARLQEVHRAMRNVWGHGERNVTIHVLEDAL